MPSDIFIFRFTSPSPPRRDSERADPRRGLTLTPQAQEVVRIDCATVTLDELWDPMSGDVRLVADTDCVVHGLALWFDVDFYGRASLSTSPEAKKTHWYQTVLMLDHPHELRAGQALEGTIELEPGSDPGRKRHLNVVVSYDVTEEEATKRAEGGAAGGGGDDGWASVDPEDRAYFREFVVQ